MSAFERVLQAARDTPRRVVLPESGDPRVLAAVAEAGARRIAQPVLLGNPDTVHRQAASLGIDLSPVHILDPMNDPRRDHLIATLVARQADRGMTTDRAAARLADPVAYACSMVREGDADACVAGATTATATVVRHAMRHVGAADGTHLVSSCFILLLQETHPVKDVMLTADCALVIDPDARQLAQIAISTGETARDLLGISPELAMLSFSTRGSARHASVSKVSKATSLVREQRPDWRVVGEVQLDAAVVPEILARKAPEQATDSPCNVLIFPSLDAGNIGYKLIERFGGARAIGPILQGLSKPVNDLSRGCSSADIVNIIAVSAAQVRAPD